MPEHVRRPLRPARVAQQVAAADGTVTNVRIRTVPGTALPTDPKRGVPRELRIAGRPAREWSLGDW